MKRFYLLGSAAIVGLMLVGGTPSFARGGGHGGKGGHHGGHSGHHGGHGGHGHHGGHAHAAAHHGGHDHSHVASHHGGSHHHHHHGGHGSGWGNGWNNGYGWGSPDWAYGYLGGVGLGSVDPTIADPMSSPSYSTPYSPGLKPPVTQVTSVNSSTPGFTVNWSGTAAGGTGVADFDVFVSVDGGAATEMGEYPGGSPNSGVYSGSTTYQAIADGHSHTYGFYSIGIDGAGTEQAAPPSPQVTVTTKFAARPASTATASTTASTDPSQASTDDAETEQDAPANPATTDSKTVSK